MRARATTSGGLSPLPEEYPEESSSDGESTIVEVVNETFSRVGTPQGRLFCRASCVVITGTVAAGIALWFINWIAAYYENYQCD